MIKSEMFKVFNNMSVQQEGIFVQLHNETGDQVYKWANQWFSTGPHIFPDGRTMKALIRKGLVTIDRVDYSKDYVYYKPCEGLWEWYQDWKASL
jgi:hypothetical protein